MKWYPWLRPDFETLVAGYQAGRGHHALLIQALPGMGDDALIYALSRWLLCQRPEGHKSCGRCRGCQLMQAGTHPDYYSLAPEKGKSALGIDAVREVSEKLYEHSRLGGGKVVWIADAALLTDAAGNALLKTLEEPPAETWFFLASREPARLLTTLRSRCRLHHLAPPPEQYAVGWLAREVTASQASLLTALRLSAGSPGAALMLLQSDGWSQRETLRQALAECLQSGEWYTLLPALNHEQAPARLHWLATLLLDALKHQQGVSHSINVDAVPLITTLADLISAARLQAILSDLCRCREQLLNVAGVNRELLLTDLLLRTEHYLRPGVALPVSHL
ncbi:DNA polymerase III subunit delta' [Intestinirhabdus alba]|jgi:DNA polymerase-3 subunit delta'|uniref:DNA polymerase III subunit delta' n=1 Tax=Intestinirhabdus alba TaxID=2899544 RepID=A0A6L6IKQ0_9ENTR|nr:DNA polymerase III subunit delta' [Intestinirhabdus alba]MTH46534.1 DNA polymerase III subunit delta' [Intestinirhabdus alba]